MFLAHGMATQQRILPVIMLELQINIDKVFVQNLRRTEKIFTDYGKKLGWAGCSIRVNTDTLVVLDSLDQAFIGGAERS